MRLRKKEGDTGYIEASFAERLSLASMLRQSLAMNSRDGTDISTYAHVEWDLIVQIAKDIEIQARPHNDLKLSGATICSVQLVVDALNTLTAGEADKHYGGYDGLSSDIELISKPFFDDRAKTQHQNT